jgi:SAM-dependent methyltransferase
VLFPNAGLSARNGFHGVILFMKHPVDSFYAEVFNRLITEGVIARDSRVLVCCGGDYDRDMLQSCGLTNVVISNLDERIIPDRFAPYEWSYQDAENLTFEDGSFDFVSVHSGLHHCHSPHRAILEMYRVARKGVLLFEPYDNLVTRVGVALGIGQDFEHAAVFHNDMKYGGVKNSEIPNYVYRLTRREIVKTITCHAPYGEHTFRFFHKLRVPWPQLTTRKNKIPMLMAAAAWPFLKLMELIAPSQMNCFGAAILKPDLKKEHYPWITVDEQEKVRLNREWVSALYNKAK